MYKIEYEIKLKQQQCDKETKHKLCTNFCKFAI